MRRRTRPVFVIGEEQLLAETDLGLLEEPLVAPAIRVSAPGVEASADIAPLPDVAQELVAPLVTEHIPEVTAREAESEAPARGRRLGRRPSRAASPPRVPAAAATVGIGATAAVIAALALQGRGEAPTPSPAAERAQAKSRPARETQPPARSGGRPKPDWPPKREPMAAEREIAVQVPSAALEPVAPTPAPVSASGPNPAPASRAAEPAQPASPAVVHQEFGP